MHLVLRSTLARGAWSFVRGGNRHLVESILAKHATAGGVEILNVGNAGNHLHLRLKLSSKKQYLRFIRAVAGEIALKIKRLPNPQNPPQRGFWDQRPFSAVVAGARYVARLIDYVKINELEGHGCPRAYARLTVKKWNQIIAEGMSQLLAMQKSESG
jgi:REP element-mobilizing transposase RayT